MQVRRRAEICVDLAPYRHRYSDTVGIDEMADLAETSAAMIRKMVDADVLVPERFERPLRFRLTALPAVRLALRLRNQLGVDWNSLPLILDLLARVETLENRVRALQRQKS